MGDIGRAVVSQSDSESVNQIHLKRRVKLYQAVAFVAATIVGSTIYISPGEILQSAGSREAMVTVWIVGGLFSLCGALCFAELATTYPASGEKFHYLDIMYGPCAAFCCAWGYIFVIRPGANAIKLLVFGKYLLTLVYPDCESPETATRLIAVLGLLVLMCVNIVNIELANRAHAFVTGISLFSLAVFSVVGMVYLGNGKTENWWDKPTKIPPFNGGDFVLTLYLTLFAYAGWNSLNFMVEEVQNPNLYIPRALMLSVGSITVLYTLVNVAYVTVLGADGVITSHAVAMAFGRRAFPVVSWLVPVVVCSSQISSSNSAMMLGSRMMFVAARRGLLPQFVALITTWSYSPVLCLLIQGGFICLCVVLLDISGLIKNLMFVLAVFDALVVAGLVKARIKSPDLHRPFKTPLAIPVVFLVTSILLLVVPIVTRPLDAATGALFSLGTSIPVYVLFITYRWRPKGLVDASGHVTRFLQKLFLCMPQEVEIIW